MSASRARFPIRCLVALSSLIGAAGAAALVPSSNLPRTPDPLTSSVAPNLISSEQPGGGWLVPQLRDDIFYLVQRPEFYGIFGGLALAPLALRHEGPEWNIQWAAQEGAADAIFEYGDKMGSAVWPLAAAGLSYSIGRLTHHEGATSFGSDLFRAHIVNGIATLSYKRVVNRTRPNGAAYNFPSGHTSVIFTTAGVVYAHFGPYWGAAAGLVSGYVGLSRLQMNRYYLSDVVGGAIMGGYLGYMVGHRRRRNAKALTVAPMVGDGTIGAAVSLKF